MGTPQIVPQNKGQVRKQFSRMFWIALWSVVIAFILLVGIIIWSLATQSFATTISFAGFIATIVGIVVGLLTILFTVPRTPDREPKGEPTPNTGFHDSVAQTASFVPSTEMKPTRSSDDTDPALASRAQLAVESSQPLSSSAGGENVTFNNSQPDPDTVQVKEYAIMATQKKYDVFLSYSSIDTVWVRDLKNHLQARGLKVWLDNDEIRPGDQFIRALEVGLEQSKAVVLVVSPESMASGWVHEEYSRALSLAHRKKHVLRLIPVILREVELPGFLANRSYVDFHDATAFEQSFERLMWGITDQNAPGEPTRSPDEIPFQAGGALLDDARCYVERKADHDAWECLRRMEYISLIEPRQQGKTSLINRLKHQSLLQNYTFVICDMASVKFKKSTEAEWYGALGEWLWSNLESIHQGAHIAFPADSGSWEQFLVITAKAAEKARKRVVIVLDEIREIPAPYATLFFTVLRSVYNERSMSPFFKFITFVIAGAFNPNELINDPDVSKYNIDRWVYLGDFDLTQVRQLVSHLSFPDAITDAVTKRIYYWTSGQPYLTQKLCLSLVKEPNLQSPQRVNTIVDRHAKDLYNDTSYIQRVTRLRERDPQLFLYVQSFIRSTNRPQFTPALNNGHFQLAYVHGIIKADSDGLCQVRNRICEHALLTLSPPTFQ